MLYHLSLPGTSTEYGCQHTASFFPRSIPPPGLNRQRHWTYPEPHACAKSCGRYSVDRSDMRDGRLRGTHGCCGFTLAPGDDQSMARDGRIEAEIPGRLGSVSVSQYSTPIAPPCRVTGRHLPGRSIDSRCFAICGIATAHEASGAIKRSSES